MATGELSRTPAVGTPATGLNFYRSHRRVVVLLFLAPVFYETWWYWQLFAFSRREGFPRARRFWWLLVPIYNWIVLYRQFDDLKHAAIRAGVRTFSSGLAIWLVIFSWWAGGASNRISSDQGSLAAFVVSAALIAIVGAEVQPTANAYLANEYPEAAPMAMTWGELTATSLGLLLFAVAILVTMTSAFSSSSSPPAHAPVRSAAPRVLPQLRPIALRTGDSFQLASTNVGCQPNRDQGVVWLDCAAFTRGSRPLPGSFGVSISSRAAILDRVENTGNSPPLVERAEPSSGKLVAAPVPRRRPQAGEAQVGSVLPIGGTPVVCDIERQARVPTLLCGLASKVSGPNNALDVTYLPLSYGVIISKVGAAIIRWNLDGTYDLIRRRSEPAG